MLPSAQLLLHEVAIRQDLLVTQAQVLRILMRVRYGLLVRTRQALKFLWLALFAFPSFVIRRVEVFEAARGVASDAVRAVAAWLSAHILSREPSQLTATIEAIQILATQKRKCSKCRWPR